MQIVILTALGVGCATVIGALIGFAFKSVPHKFNDMILSFAAGIMLAATAVGLVLPAIEYAGSHGVWIAAAGILTGAIFLNLMDRLTPHLHKVAGTDIESHEHNAHLGKTLLFVMAIAIHNLPEGLAAGVSFGTGNLGDAFTVAGGIALQNIPEGMIIIAPLLSLGVSKLRTFAIASFTGFIEVVGTLLGYFAITVASFILPFALAFAGGTMLYIISDEMIPETHSHGHERQATYSLLVGFILMLIMDYYIG